MRPTPVQLQPPSILASQRLRVRRRVWQPPAPPAAGGCTRRSLPFSALWVPKVTAEPQAADGAAPNEPARLLPGTAGTPLHRVRHSLSFHWMTRRATSRKTSWPVT